MKVLYDGWSLAYRPNGPAALHVLTLLAHCPPEVEAHLAVPAGMPFQVDGEISIHVEPQADRESAHLKWEQSLLPGLARRLGARLVHLSGANAALLGRTFRVISPTGPGMDLFRRREQPRQAGLVARWREAVGAGGSRQARLILWPADLPKPDLPVPVSYLPPVEHPAFTSQGTSGQAVLDELDLVEPYILYHGPYAVQDLRALLAAWSWAAEPIGGDYPLALLGLDESARAKLPALLAECGLSAPVRALPALPLDALAGVYQNCSVLFHPAEVSPWGSSVRRALACGKPVVALQTGLTDAMVGPAGYLVPGNNSDPAVSRALGAALITVCVEESVAAELSQAARQRLSAWSSAAFSRELAAAYRLAANIPPINGL